jgi:hypothetical protein
MSEYYYTIFRHKYELPDYLDDDLSDDTSPDYEDCFEFDTEHEANQCLRAIFNNGEPMVDEKYGECRYYVVRKPVSTTIRYVEP